ncbi:MAG: hypothetical protein LH466_08040 [Sphingomonas bacterium]|nr:hypothetical protein [Sphingomonas bacterium]
MFGDAELLVQQMNTSRSDLYARALTAFINTHALDRVTQRMDDVVDSLGGEAGPFSKQAARRVFDRVEW